MCGRYTLSTHDGHLVAQRFDVEEPVSIEPHVLRRFNVCPSEEVLAIDHERGARRLKWGLELPGGRKPPPINARAETAATRPLFAGLLESSAGRCLVPADGWYEWLRAERPGNRPAPFRHTVDDGELFAFAGLYSRGSVAILTTTPNAVCARLHDRMPCVLAGPHEEAAWLDPALDGRAAAELLRPLPVERVTVVPASREVNRAGREGPELLAAEPTLF
jgi:putative SOS response-associated peptidase YedK